MKRVWVLVGLTLTAACAPSQPRYAPQPAPAAVQPTPARYDTPTPYVTPKPSSQPPAPATAADACGAAAHQYLVGKNRSEIPVPVDPRNRRVYCSSCPVTMDYNPRRLNIVYDQGSGNVTEVKCG
jgi:hypothetical protein